MERLTNNPPCKGCAEDRQVGNPYEWQTPCYNCGKKAEWISNQLIRLAAIEDILGDDYDLERLKEAVKLIDKLSARKWHTTAPARTGMEGSGRDH